MRCLKRWILGVIPGGDKLTPRSWSKEFGRDFTASQFTQLANHHVLVRILTDGAQVDPFHGEDAGARWKEMGKTRNHHPPESRTVCFEARGGGRTIRRWLGEHPP